MASKTIVLEIEYKNGQIVSRELEKTRDAAKDIPAHVQKGEKALQGMRSAIAAVAAAWGTKELFGVLTEAENATVKLEAALRAMNKYTPEVSRNFQSMAAELQGVSRYGDEALLGYITKFLTLGNLREDQIKRSMTAAMDLAVVTGDLESAVTLLAKASHGETSTLARYGLIIDETVPKNQKFEAALKLIEDRMGGLEEKMAQTAEGAVTQMSNAFGDLLEVGLLPLAPAIRDAANALKEFMNVGANGETMGVIKALEGQLDRAKAALGRMKKDSVMGMGGAFVKIPAATEAQIRAQKLRISAIQDALTRMWKKFHAEKVGPIDLGGDYTKKGGDGAALPDKFMGVSQLDYLMRSDSFYSKRNKELRERQRAGEMSSSGLFISQLPDALKDIEEPTINLGSVVDSLQEKYSLLGDTIGTMFSDITSGSMSAGRAMAKAMLSAVGQLAMMKGQFWILEGSAQMAAMNPLGAEMVRNGILMTALGGVIQGMAGAVSGGRGSGGGRSGYSGGGSRSGSESGGGTRIIIIGTNGQTYNGGSNVSRALQKAGIDRSMQFQVSQVIREINRTGQNVSELR